jgi:hypothetical protein
LSEASNAPGGGGIPRARAPTPWSRLLPVLAITAAVAVMIVSGIARNQARLRATRGTTERHVEALRRLMQDGARFLAAQPPLDGSRPLATGPPLPGPPPRLPAPVAELDTVTLAAYVKARAEQCLEELHTCSDLNPAVGALVSRKRPDGSWASAAGDGTGGSGHGRAGAAAEATSGALEGLAAYLRVLEGRADGSLVPEESRVGRPRSPSPAGTPRRK